MLVFCDSTFCVDLNYCKLGWAVSSCSRIHNYACVGTSNLGLYQYQLGSYHSLLWCLNYGLILLFKLLMMKAPHSNMTSVIKQSTSGSSFFHQAKDRVKPLETHCKNVVFSSRRELLGGNRAGLGFDEELSAFISILDAVRDLGVRSLIPVWCYDPIHRVSLHGSLFLRPLSLRELDLIDLFQKHRPIVILVQDSDDDADSGGSGRNAVVTDCDLRRKDKNFRTRSTYKQRSKYWRYHYMSSMAHSSS